MANEAPVTVVETHQFAAAAHKAKLAEGEVFAIVDHLSRSPEAGDPHPGRRGSSQDSVCASRRRQTRRISRCSLLHGRIQAVVPPLGYDKAYKADLTAVEKKELATLARQLKKAFATTKR